MRTTTRLTAWSLAAVLGGLAGAGGVLADDDGERGRGGRGFALYEVAITNLTGSQVFSPPVVATHTAGISVFEVGLPASPELALVAEAGMGEPLVSALEASYEVFDAVAASAPILPGQTGVIEVASRGRFGRLSVVGMLVNTNDAFLGSERELPRGRGNSRSYVAVAYDAGSEVNNEECAYVPGPACPMDSGNARDVEAKGFVHVHNGVHGVGDLAPEDYDWRNPVARIVVTRVR